jgi:hypothetical protein
MPVPVTTCGRRCTALETGDFLSYLLRAGHFPALIGSGPGRILVKSVFAFVAVVLLALVGLPAVAQQVFLGEPAAGQKLTLTQGYSLTDADVALIQSEVLSETADQTARFSDVRAMADNYGNVSVCGLVNAKDENGRLSGMVPFTGTLEDAPVYKAGGVTEDPPATDFTLLAVGGGACERCLTFGARSVPSLACWKTGRGTVPSP